MKISNIKLTLIPLFLLGTGLTSQAYSAEDISVLKDIDYLTTVDYEDNRDKLDVYLPKQTKNAPVLVHFHGGGLTSGSKERGSRGYSTAFAKQGLCVVAPNYRLAPQHKFPAQINDATAAISWAEKNMAAHGCDISNIYVSGHSAGAYLTALLSVDAKYYAQYPNLAGKIKGAIPISPLLNLKWLEPDHLEKVWGTDKSVYAAASVTSYVTPNKMPMLIMYGDNDHKDMDIKIADFAKNMKMQNNDIAVIEAKNRDHKSIINHINKADDMVLKSVMAFIK
jgi:acetyl esterase/lipase